MKSKSEIEKKIIELEAKLNQCILLSEGVPFEKAYPWQLKRMAFEQCLAYMRWVVEQ